jgi:hypothetical protein
MKEQWKQRFADAPALPFWGMKKRNFFGIYRFWLSFISCAGVHSAPIPPMVYSPQKKGGKFWFILLFLFARFQQ